MDSSKILLLFVLLTCIEVALSSQDRGNDEMTDKKANLILKKCMKDYNITQKYMEDVVSDKNVQNIRPLKDYCVMGCLFKMNAYYDDVNQFSIQRTSALVKRFVGAKNISQSEVDMVVRNCTSKFHHLPFCEIIREFMACVEAFKRNKLKKT